MKKILIYSMLLFGIWFVSTNGVHAATKTWTGATSSNWQVATNWSGGIPGAGDVARFTQAGLNRAITNVPTVSLQQIIVATTGAAVSYSFSSTGPVTITLANGSTGVDLSVGTGCELILNPGVNLTIGGALTASIAGNLVLGGTFNVNTTGNIVVTGSVHMNGMVSMNNNRTITGTGTWFVDVGNTMTVNTNGARFVLQTAYITNNGTISVAANTEFRPEPVTSFTSSGSSVISLAGNSLFRSSGTCSVANITSAAGSIFRVFTGTLTASGTSAISGTLNVASGSTLIITGALTLNSGGTMVHAGTITINPGGTFTDNVSFSSGNNATINVNGILWLGTGVTWTLSGPTATCVVSATGNITGEGNMSHGSGILTVNGLITVAGNFSNSSPLTGTGTIEIGGTFTNTSTMFVYPGVPPGKIISGYTWRGLTNTAWGTTTNWWAGVVPVTTGDAVVYATTNKPLISTTGQVCRRLYIHNDAAQVTISPTGQLTAFGKTTLGGGGGTPGSVKLVIKSTAGGTGSFIDNGTFDGVGVASVERYLAYGTSGMWHYICIPMTQVNAFTYFDQFMKYYKEPVHHYMYVIAPSDSTLNSVGLGYAMWPQYSDWVAVQNGIPNTGTINIPISRTYDPLTSDFDGWNLVGNPFTSAVDLAQSLQTGISTDVDPAAWFWDPNAGNYTVYPLGGGGSHSQYCPAGQGFFTHCNDINATPSSPGVGNVKLTPQSRLHNSGAFLKETRSDILKINVIGSPNSYWDDMSIYFDDDLTMGYDAGFDAVKIEGLPEAPQLCSLFKEYRLAVNALPFSESSLSIPVEFRAGQYGSYLLSFSEIESLQPDIQVMLEDLQEGILQDIRNLTTYSFSHTPQDDPARFLLHFTRSGLTSGEGREQQGLKIYSTGHSIMLVSSSGAVAGTVTVSDLLGRTIDVRRVESQGSCRLEFPTAHGYYIVKVVGNTSTAVGKIYLE